MICQLEMIQKTEANFILGKPPSNIFSCYLDTCTWTKLYPSVDIPVPSCKPSTTSTTSPNSGTVPGRYAHSCVWYKGRIFMYGGRNDYRFFNEIECYDPGTLLIVLTYYATVTVSSKSIYTL